MHRGKSTSTQDPVRFCHSEIYWAEILAWYTSMIDETYPVFSAPGSTVADNKLFLYVQLRLLVQHVSADMLSYM